MGIIHAAIGVNHFKKGKAETSNDKTINSMAFTSKPRACRGIVNKKDDPTIKILALGKHNIRANKMALQFRIENHDLHENGQTIETCKVVYLDEQLDTDLDTLIKEAFDHRKTTKEAEPWLAELLDNGDVDSEQVYTAGNDAGFSWRQIRDAKDKLKVRARKHGIGKDSKWKWHLDKHEVPAEPANLTEDELNDDPF